MGVIIIILLLMIIVLLGGGPLLLYGGAVLGAWLLVGLVSLILAFPFVCVKLWWRKRRRAKAGCR